MYGIFEVSGDAIKRQVCDKATFATIADALASFGGAVVHSEMDHDGHDACDFMTKAGNVFAVERIKA